MRWLLLLGLLLLGGLGAWWFWGEERIQVNNIATGPKANSVDRFTVGNLLIVKPKTIRQTAPVLLIFGGISYATPAYMLKNTPSVLFERFVLVYAPCRYMGGSGFKATWKQAQNWLKTQKLQASRLSVCGFSGGSGDAMEAAVADEILLRTVGLIDPEPLTGRLSGTKAKVLLSYYAPNWRGNETYGESSNFGAFKELVREVKALGGRAEEKAVAHEDFPKYMLYKFRQLF